MMEHDINHYTYRVTWSDEDKEFVGLCAEFPGLSWLGGKPETALKGVRRVVGEVLEDMQAAGEKIPPPLSLKKFSGKFQLRIPPEVHREITVRAAESGVSLNRWVSSKLILT